MRLEIHPRPAEQKSSQTEVRQISFAWQQTVEQYSPLYVDKKRRSTNRHILNDEVGQNDVIRHNKSYYKCDVST